MGFTHGHFEQVAAAIIERTAELLSTEVLVTDERGTIVASSRRCSIGTRYSANARIAEALRIPIRLDSHAGEVIVERPADGDTISPKVARALIDLMIDQASVVARLPNQYELKNKFIHDLLMGTIADDADILREGQVLGMDFTPPRAVVLIDAAEYILRGDGAADATPEYDGTGIRKRAQHVIASVVRFFNLPNDTICGYIGNGEIALLKASTTQDLVDWMREDDRVRPAPTWANLAALKRAGNALLARLQRDTRSQISIAIGRYHPGIRGLSQSYRDASLALALGRRLHGPDRVHCLDGIGIAAFVGVADERTKVDLARHLLRPLDGEPELRRTLEVFFSENCSPSQTAAQLAVHRNTLGYRLERISTLLDLDPRIFDDAVQLRVALLLRAFHTDA